MKNTLECIFKLPRQRIHIYDYTGRYSCCCLNFKTFEWINSKKRNLLKMQSKTHKIPKKIKKMKRVEQTKSCILEMSCLSHQLRWEMQQWNFESKMTIATNKQTNSWRNIYPEADKDNEWGLFGPVRPGQIGRWIFQIVYELMIRNPGLCPHIRGNITGQFYAFQLCHEFKFV